MLIFRLLRRGDVRAPHDLPQLGDSARQHRQLHGLVRVGAATLVHHRHSGKHPPPRRRQVRVQWKAMEDAKPASPFNQNDMNKMSILCEGPE